MTFINYISLLNIIKKIDNLSSNIINKSKFEDNKLELMKEKNRNLELQIELLKLSNNISSWEGFKICSLSPDIW